MNKGNLYRSVNYAAHRRPAAVVGAPSLNFCHAYRAPSPAGTAAQEEAKATRSAWEGNVQTLLYKLFRKIVWHDGISDEKLLQSSFNAALVPQPDGQATLRAVSVLRAIFDIDKPDHVAMSDGAALKRIDELSLPDYSVFSFEGTLLFDPGDGTQTSAEVKIWAELHTEYFAISGHIDLCRQTEDGTTTPCGTALGHVIEGLAAVLNQQEAGNLAGAREMVLDGVWANIFAEIDQAPGIGDCFADFRSLVLSVDPAAEAPGAADAPVRLRNPHWRHRRASIRDLTASRKKFERATSIPLIHAIWAFLGEDVDHRLRSREAAVSWFLDQQVIYVSTLGPPPIDPRDIEVQRLDFVLLTSSPDRWQTGRLVNRLHQLGIARLAALFDIENLVDASSHLQRAGSAVDALYGPFAHGTLGASAAEVQTLFGILDAVGKSFPYGLSYRIERSRYYVRQYEDGLEQLRDERIEGFQRYTDFVKRRVGVRFDFVDRLGVRYERLTQRIQLLNSQVLATQSTALTDKLVTAETQVTSLQEEIALLQQKAEDFVILFICPYYVGTLIFYILVYPCYAIIAYLVTTLTCLTVPEREAAEPFLHGLGFVISTVIFWSLYKRGGRKLIDLVRRRRAGPAAHTAHG